MTSGQDESPAIIYDPHARRQMRDRRITERQVEAVLKSYHTSYPADPLPHTLERSTIFIGEVDGRDLKVYVLQGSQPPYVKTVVWKGDE
jgi:hypothetical protein